jgi:Zn-dependent protease with chaperone function
MRENRIVCKRLKNLHPSEYEHPFDTKALEALKKTPGLDMVVRQFSKHVTERLMTIQHIGSGIRVTSGNYPQIYTLLDKVCDIMDRAERPEFYLEYNKEINGFTVGVDRPIVVLTHGTIDDLSDREKLFLIGHEMGHILSQHVLYHQIASYLPSLGNLIGKFTLGVGELISAPLTLALYHWSRMSELTADRAGLLACQDLETASRVMMKFAGMPSKYYEHMDVAVFQEQARHFESLDYERLNRMAKFMSIMNSTHPWTVMRAAELLRWVEVGGYQQIIDRHAITGITKQ